MQGPRRASPHALTLGGLGFALIWLPRLLGLIENGSFAVFRLVWRNFDPASAGFLR